MATTTKSNVIIPDLWNEAVAGAFSQKTAFMGANMAKLGAAVVRGDFPRGNRGDIGDSIKVPYFGVIGDFALTSDGTALTAVQQAQTSESATVAHAGLAIEVTRWLSRALATTSTTRARAS